METIEPSESDRQCGAHGAKTPIGYDETQTLEFLPPKLQVRVRRFMKYVCEKHAECGVTQPPRPPALVAGNRYDISVAIQVILSKYAYHLPLYRQQDLFAACGWTPSRSTLNNLLAAIDELFWPFVAVLRDAETRAKESTPEERRALREAEARPVLERIREFLLGATYEQALPKSKLREAMNYARNNWDELQTYVTDGRLPIDNNDVEQLMRQVAIGRKNWLFVGSVAAGERAARLISVMSSALRNDLDVERYLTDVLRQLLNGCTDYRSLLPHVWRESHPEAVRTYRVEERRDAHERQQRRREERRRRKPLSADFTPAEQAEILRRAKEKLLAKRAKRAAGRGSPQKTNSKPSQGK